MTVRNQLPGIIPWWAWIITIDVFLIFVTSFHYDRDSLFQGWRLLSAFNLGMEMNLAVWWSAMLQVTLALICFEKYESLDKNTVALPWILLSILFFILAFDELASVHERISDLALYGLYMPVIFILANYSIFRLFREEATKKTAILIFLGFCFYGSVFIQELLEHRLDFPIWFKGIRLAIEEGSELLGTLLILTGVVQQRKEIDGNFVTKVIAKPMLGLPFKKFLWVGLFVHGLICYFIIPSLNDLSVRGDPGSFYPALVGFILFCFFFWKSKESESWKTYLVLALIFLFASMSCIYNFGKLFPVWTLVLPSGLPVKGYLLSCILLISGVLLFLITSLKTNNLEADNKHVSLKGILLLALMVVTPLIGFFSESVAQVNFLLGCLSFITAQYVLLNLNR